MIRHLLLTVAAAAFAALPAAPVAAQRALAQGPETSGPASQRLAITERFRPQFHVTPPQNWINDPNGMVWYKGEWHLFYQHNPFGDVWGHMSWGHAVSPDLVHWTHLPVALAEENGVMIFSGSAVVDQHNTSGFCTSQHPRDQSCLVAIYTTHTETRQSQSLAYSNDRGRTWTKYVGNPVLDIGAKDFRDPKVFWHAPKKRWIMVVSLADKHQVRLYASPNLKQWTRLSEFGPAGASNGVWECPDLFELPVDGQAAEKKWVLVVNINPGAPAGGSGAQYFVGTFDGTRFRSDDVKTRWADYGKDFYAAVSWSDVPASDGRRVWLAWMSNWEYATKEPTAPFRGAMTIPRTLSLHRQGNELVLAQQPVRELRSLRRAPAAVTALSMADGTDVLAGRALGGDAIELEVDIALGTARAIALEVLRGAKEATVVGYDAVAGRLFIDRTRSGATAFSNTFAGRHEVPFTAADGHLRLHVFVDRSSVEVLSADGTVSLTDRVFPSPGSTAIALTARGGTATLVSLRRWTLAAPLAAVPK